MPGLRAATAHDAEALAEIHAAAFGPDAWSEVVFAAQFAIPGVFGLLHAADGLVLARVAADESEILTLGVVPSARGRGIGADLLRRAGEIAAGAGATCMYLEVAVGNAAARRLYARAGFEEVGRRPGYYSDQQDALVLRAPLPPEQRSETGAGSQGPRRRRKS
ncbi:MAG: hypothetical protein BGO51_07115 [Rhodospirillales bacterium 69-11]|nr:MAG: hypothetical protein BGO51_07115 [Rhodospirillales bacterium 69-11]